MLSALPGCARRHAVWDVYQTPLMHGLAVLMGVSLGADRLWGYCLPMAIVLSAIGALCSPAPCGRTGEDVGSSRLAHQGMINAHASVDIKVASAIPKLTTLWKDNIALRYYHGARNGRGKTPGTLRRPSLEMRCNDQGPTFTVMGFWLPGTGPC